MDSNSSNLLYLRNLQEQVKKAFCYQRLFWPFTVWTNCSSDLKKILNSRPSASNFKKFSQSLEQFFLTVGQNNFGNKIPSILIVKPMAVQPFNFSSMLLLYAYRSTATLYRVSQISMKIVKWLVASIASWLLKDFKGPIYLLQVLILKSKKHFHFIIIITYTVIDKV